MLGGNITRGGTKGEFHVEASWPAIAAATVVTVGTTHMMEIFLGQVDSGVVPWVAVTAVAGFHGYQRCL